MALSNKFPLKWKWDLVDDLCRLRIEGNSLYQFSDAKRGDDADIILGYTFYDLINDTKEKLIAAIKYYLENSVMV